MRRLAIAVLIVLFAFSTALPGICPQSESQTTLEEAQPLGEWGVGSGVFNDFSQTLLVAGEPLRHVVADFNNDSRPDIAVIYNSSFRIDIFYSDVDDRFNYTDRTTVDMPGPVTDITCGDVDKDLRTDLVVSCNVTTGNDVFVLSQTNGFDKDAPLFAISSTFKPRALLLEDFNGDSWLDIATLFYADVPPYQPGFEIRLHSENYELNMIPVDLSSDPLNMQRPSFFISGNFDIGNQTDVVIGDRDIDKVVGYVNGAPSGKVWTTMTNVIVASNPSALHMAQLVAGGDMNLMVAEEGSSKINIWQYSAGAFSLRTDVVQQASITSMATIDINRDSRLDLVATSAANHDLTVFRASSTLLYSKSDSLTFPTPYHPVYVVPTDMDLDGILDLVVSARSSSGHGSITIYYGSGQSLSNADRNLLVKDIAPTHMSVGDFNGDGRKEIAAYEPSGPTLSFVNETSASLRQIFAPAGILAMESADLDGDGKDDVVMMSASYVTVYFGDEGIFNHAFQPRHVTVNTTLPSLASLLVADLNHDGRPDLTVGGEGGVQAFWNSGTDNLYSDSQRYTLSLPGASVTGMATLMVKGSVHNDERTDLVIINSTASRMEIYFQQTGEDLFTPASSNHLNVVSGLFQLRAGDLDSDSLDDLAVLSPDNVHIYLQSHAYSLGFSASQPVEVIEVPEGPRQLRLGDLDDDGGLDLALVTSNSTVLAYVHEGSSFSLLTRQTAGASPVLLSVGDSNGDQKDDLVAWSSTSRTVSFYHQNNFPPVAIGHVEGSGHLEGDHVLFNATQSYDGLSDMRVGLNYTWDLGDESIGYGVLCHHTYLRNDTYTVTLTVRDQDGLYNLTSFPVVIGDRGPTASFSYTGDTLEGSPLQFNDQSVSFPDTIVSWLWDFGDGNSSIEQNPQYTYLADGNYTVTLTVTDYDGSTAVINDAVSIADAAPISQFQVSPSTPSEGETALFTDQSDSFPDSIVGWSWDFGDGNGSTEQSPAHIYRDNGTYLVVLTVRDIDGSESSSNLTLTVVDTTPSIVGIFIVNDAPFDEWDEITFQVVTTLAHDQIVSYHWAIQNETADVERTTLKNSTSYRWSQPGTYEVTVQVWDLDSCAEASLEITIVDPAPVPDFFFTYTDRPREVRFSAALTTDTENDMGALWYRWSPEGTWTSWSQDVNFTYTFPRNGVFSVKLEVKDDHNLPVLIARNVSVNVTFPVISLDDPVLRAKVGEPIVITALVTDPKGIDSVILHFTIDNATSSLVMTLEDVNTYFGQIPAQNRSKEISYYITATNLDGYYSSTDLIVISVEYEDPALFMLSSAVLLMALLIVIIYLFLSRPIVDEVFVMYHDGTLLAHQTRRLKPGMDDQILGGMLIALQNFVRDSFKDENFTVLRRLDFGERKILVERKDDFFLAVLLSGKRAGAAPQRMQKVLDVIDEHYAKVLKEWNGDLEKVRGIRDDTKQMFQRGNPLDRLRHREGDGDSF